MRSKRDRAHLKVVKNHHVFISRTGKVPNIYDVISYIMTSSPWRSLFAWRVTYTHSKHFISGKGATSLSGFPTGSILVSFLLFSFYLLVHVDLGPTIFCFSNFTEHWNTIKKPFFKILTMLDSINFIKAFCKEESYSFHDGLMSLFGLGNLIITSQRCFFKFLERQTVRTSRTLVGWADTVIHLTFTAQLINFASDQFFDLFLEFEILPTMELF